MSFLENIFNGFFVTAKRKSSLARTIAFEGYYNVKHEHSMETQ